MDENSPPIVVPSDVTICENLYTTGTRELPFIEKVGLSFTPNPIRLNYTRNGRYELESVLSKKFDENSDAVSDLLLTRQKSISRNVKVRAFAVGGSLGLGLWSLYLLRFHVKKTKLIVAPFAFYFGSIIGREVGNFYFGKWSEYTTERALGNLPAKRFLTKLEQEKYLQE